MDQSDVELRNLTYRLFAELGRPPTVEDVGRAAALDRCEAEPAGGPGLEAELRERAIGARNAHRTRQPRYSPTTSEAQDASHKPSTKTS